MENADNFLNGKMLHLFPKNKMCKQINLYIETIHCSSKFSTHS